MSDLIAYPIADAICPPGSMVRSAWPSNRRRCASKRRNGMPLRAEVVVPFGPAGCLRGRGEARRLDGHERDIFLCMLAWYVEWHMRRCCSRTTAARRRTRSTPCQSIENPYRPSSKSRSAALLNAGSRLQDLPLTVFLDSARLRQWPSGARRRRPQDHETARPAPPGCRNPSTRKPNLPEGLAAGAILILSR